jgi:hypothetical protein
MKLTQCERILRHLEDFGSISQLEAIAEYGIMRLASKITDLKRQGYLISANMVKGKNRYGEPTHYAVYRLVKEGENNV